MPPRPPPLPTRNLAGVAAHFHVLWRDSVRSRRIPVQSPVFADDCGAGYDPSIRKEYLALRAAYGKLIKIDSPGPDLTVPVTMLTGIDCDFDYGAGTVAISQRTYTLLGY